ncbi:MAG: hypothetical protein KatS3mg101_0893 [Patescibacteria group bacterium]|nr:MAG: hypothetical protein KatS3mg101_0893 [Patescibacteria group bacterium]
MESVIRKYTDEKPVVVNGLETVEDDSVVIVQPGNNNSLEAILENYSNASMVFVIGDKMDITEVDGWTIKEEKYRTGRGYKKIIVCLRETVSLKEIASESSKLIHSSHKVPNKFAEIVKGIKLSSYEDTKSNKKKNRFESFVESIPQEIKVEKENRVAWVKALRKHLSSLLKPITDDVSSLLDGEKTRVWMQAFIHSSYDPEFNYERLETLGDSILKYVFRKYLFQRFPKISSAQITNFDTYYMSKNYQASISNKLKLNLFLLTKDDINSMSISEDLFESFIGALDVVGDMIDFGFGSVLVFKFIRFIFDDVEFNDKRTVNPKTFITQTASRLWGVDSIAKVIGKRDDRYVCRFNFNEDVNQFFDSLKIKLPVIEGEGSTEKGATVAAYQNFYNFLLRKGITKDVVDKIKARMDLLSLKESNSELVEKAIKKSLSLYRSADIRFINNHSTNSLRSRMIEMVVVKPSGNIVLIDSVNEERNVTRETMCINLLSKFVS